MSKYTTELRYLPKEDFDNAMSAYPIFDEVYRPTLNTLIYNRFYFHEIGFESVDRFFFELANAMREIMPLYNQYYNGELLEFDPFVEYSRELNQTTGESANVFDKIKELMNETNNTENDKTSNTKSKSDSTSNQNDTSTNKTNVSQNDNSFLEDDNSTTESGTANAKGVGSKTPGKLLAIGTIESNVYASDAQISENTDTKTQTVKNKSNATNNSNVDSKNDTESNSLSTDETNVDSTVTDKGKVDSIKNANSEKESESNSTKNQEIVSRETGHNTSKTRLLIELRESFINVDMMILNSMELNECFMQVY